MKKVLFVLSVVALLSFVASPVIAQVNYSNGIEMKVDGDKEKDKKSETSDSDSKSCDKTEKKSCDKSEKSPCCANKKKSSGDGE